MNELKSHTPNDIPPEIQIYDTIVKQSDVKKLGAVGILNLELQNSNDKTIITKQFFLPPLQIIQALYPEESLPEMAYIYIISTSGGILQGDRYKIDISLKNNAITHITTQGATRIYGMNNNYSSQILNLTINENCYLEYIPEQTIPYKNSRYYNLVNLNVHDTSTLIYSEVLTAGRVAMGESFEYDIYYQKVHCTNQDKKIRFLENIKIEPKKQSLNDFGIFGKYDTIGTLYILTRKEIVIELERIINQSIKNTDTIPIGASIISDESGIIIKILANKTDDIFGIIFKILEITRKKILGASFSGIRKN